MIFLVTAFRAALIEDVDWVELRKRADELIPLTDGTAAGMVYIVGAAIRSPLPQALQLYRSR